MLIATVAAALQAPTTHVSTDVPKIQNVLAGRSPSHNRHTKASGTSSQSKAVSSATLPIGKKKSLVTSVIQKPIHSITLRSKKHKQDQLLGKHSSSFSKY